MKIAIVGAGPRGLSAAERVIEWARKTEINVQLTLFDPYGRWENLASRAT